MGEVGMLSQYEPKKILITRGCENYWVVLPLPCISQVMKVC